MSVIRSWAVVACAAVALFLGSPAMTQSEADSPLLRFIPARSFAPLNRVGTVVSDWHLPEHPGVVTIDYYCAPSLRRTGQPVSAHAFLFPATGVPEPEFHHRSIGDVMYYVGRARTEDNVYEIDCLRIEESPWGFVCAGRYHSPDPSSMAREEHYGWGNHDLGVRVWISMAMYGLRDEPSPGLPDLVLAYLERIPSTLPVVSLDWNDWCRTEVGLCLADMRSEDEARCRAARDRLYQLIRYEPVREIPTRVPTEARVRAREGQIREIEVWWEQSRATIDFNRTAFGGPHSLRVPNQGEQHRER